MRRSRTQAHDKEVQRLFLFLGVGIGIVFGIWIAIDGCFDIDDDTDSDPGISRYPRYSRCRI